MKNISQFLKPLFCVFSLGIISVIAGAQKLPAVQKVSLRAPADIKIDGKTTEWDNKFQAYNHHTDCYYTLSNDDKNLYLTIKVTDPVIIRRIINGSITFTINRSGKKNDKDGMSITYPLFGKGNPFSPTLKRSVGGIVRASDVILRDNTDTTAYIRNNTNMAAKSRFIKVAGIKTVDTISIYNTDGIKTAELFDNKLAYTYELSVALKQLDISVTNPVKFVYQLRVNEVNEQGAGQAATYFWGEYTLAKQ